MRALQRTGTAALIPALLLAGCGVDGDGSGVDGVDGKGPGRDAAIAAFLDDTVPEGSSGTLVAALDGEMVACDGWGLVDRTAGAAAGCDTVYDVMSMTKQFTAAAVLRLQMQGRLRVDDRIGRHLEGVPADKRDITVHHLLTHTSGLVDTLGGDHEPISRADLVSDALGSPLQTPPGATYLYSNVGYSLLAAIVEEASGSGYEEYLAENLFAPAGMTHTGYVLPDWDSAEVAVEYDEHGNPHGRPFDHPWSDDGPYWNLRGNGGMLSTARDMYRWHLALEGDHVLDDGAKQQLFEPWVREEPDGETFYGYGWVVQEAGDGPLLWHNGGNHWSYGEIARLPESRAMVFWIANQSRGEAPDWNFEELGPTITEGTIERIVDES